ncbi:HXXEE domain-containing protein [Actinocatenispora rupis]|uniref:Membrane protein n=1 Tax=Actinocatenispora rupis TaxID=519421 RepID=A0A8J3IVZ5_9ACTN|nr:HXXEE domain-containing protein [Actinocatenispora rupis]GID09615.1 membrane protein [Actinocatenispora rupis]
MSTVDKKVTWGLLAAWALHDLEELVTMAAWTRRAVPRLRERYPRIPARLLDGLRTTGPEAAVSIGLMGAVVALAAYRGDRTGGRSVLYQAVLVAFGAHVATHAGSALAYRGYTPGVLTAPTVAAPFTAWACWQLRKAGVPLDRRALRLAMPVLGAVTAGVHVAARGALRRR